MKNKEIEILLPKKISGAYFGIDYNFYAKTGKLHHMSYDPATLVKTNDYVVAQDGSLKYIYKAKGLELRLEDL